MAYLKLLFWCGLVLVVFCTSARGVKTSPKTSRLQRIENRQKIIDDRQRIMENRQRVMESTIGFESLYRREDTEKILSKMTDIEIMLNKTQESTLNVIDKDEMMRLFQRLENKINNKVNNNNVITSLCSKTVPDIADKTKNILNIVRDIQLDLQSLNLENAKLYNHTALQIEKSIHESSLLVSSKFENQLQTCSIRTGESVNRFLNIRTELSAIERLTNKLLRVQFPDQQKSCLDHFNLGATQSGLYKIYPIAGIGPTEVFCDQETDGGGWTVFQRRQDGSVDFFRNWTDYETGFGELIGEFWLGNNILSFLTAGNTHELRIELDNTEDRTKNFVKYAKFKVGSKLSGYVLTVDGFSGDKGDELSFHNGMKFTTKDKDNDLFEKFSGNCAHDFKGAWWYNDCFGASLNGVYHKASRADSSFVQCICWGSSCSPCYTNVEMKFR